MDDPKGYQPINSHPNGPATIDCDEFGDSWHEAMTKIDAMLNEGFARILALEAEVRRLSQPVPLQDAPPSYEAPPPLQEIDTLPHPYRQLPLVTVLSDQH